MPTPPRRTVGPRLLALEDRSLPATLIGLTDANALVTFDSAAPAKVSAPVAVSGLNSGERLLAIDARPATGQLFGLTDASRLVRIDPGSGAATVVSTLDPAVSGSVGFDFNPAVDKLRVVTGSGQNLRVNADTGAVVATDPNLAYDADRFDAAVGGTPPAPGVAATAYTLNTTADGKTVTTQYVIDANLNLLSTQGGPGDDPDSPSPNTGRLFVVDQLGFDAGPDTGFDIVPGTDMAFATTGGKLFSINLATGAGTLVGAVGGSSTPLVGLAVAPPATGAGTFQLSAAAAAFPDDGRPLLLTVTRTGGNTGEAKVNFATADGTATGGVDFLPTNGTLTFAAGQTTALIPLLLPGPPASPTANSTFTVTLSAPTGGATLGATTTTTVTIPDLPDLPGGTRGRTFAVASGAGSAVVVNVFGSAAGGTPLFTLRPFESSFTGGATVAVGDVTGDGIDDIIIGTGVGGSPRVRVVSGADQSTVADFFAYEDTFRGGVNVAVGDVDGDGFLDVLIGSGVGGGPRVRVISGDGLTSATQTGLADFFAFENTFRGGVNVGAGEFTGDGITDILAGAGFGGGPRVRVFDGSTVAAGGAEPPALADFFAFESSFRNGVLVAAGDVTGNGRDDVIAGAGPGGGPAVRVFDPNASGTPVQSFFAGPSSDRGGVRVTAFDADADGVSEILTAGGPGTTGRVRVFANGTETGGFDVFGGSTDGVFVG